MQSAIFADAAREKEGVVVATDADDDLVGAADLAAVRGGNALYVLNVCVHPRARRCGIGVKMCEELERIASERGVPALALHVDDTNEGAIALYRGLGYAFGSGEDESLQAAVKEFEDGEHAQLLMTKRL